MGWTMDLRSMATLASLLVAQLEGKPITLDGITLDGITLPLC